MSELLGRAVEILDVLSRAESDLTIREIAAKVELPKSSVQRLLRGLVDNQMAVQDSRTRCYRLGPRTLAFGMAYQRRIDIRGVAMPYMARLRDRTGETVGLSVVVGEELLHIDQVQSGSELRRTFEIGRPLPLWCGAPSRLVLAAMPDTEVERIARERVAGDVVPAKPPEPDELLELVRQARVNGFATAFEETLIGVNTIAAPVYGESDQLLATIAVTGPCVRFDEDAMAAARPDLLTTAEAVSRELGGARRR